jgi:hypothetical protein
MKERRKFPRFPLALNAEYIGGKNKRKDCRITNISREGTRLMFYSKEDIDIPSDIQLEIEVPSRDTPVPASVTLKWAKALHEQKEFDLMGGCTLKEIDDADKWSLLDYAYDNWHAEEMKKPENDLKEHPGLAKSD